MNHSSPPAAGVVVLLTILLASAGGAAAGADDGGNTSTSHSSDASSSDKPAESNHAPGAQPGKSNSSDAEPHDGGATAAGNDDRDVEVGNATEPPDEITVPAECPPATHFMWINGAFNLTYDESAGAVGRWQVAIESTGLKRNVSIPSQPQVLPRQAPLHGTLAVDPTTSSECLWAGSHEKGSDVTLAWAQAERAWLSEACDTPPREPARVASDRAARVCLKISGRTGPVDVTAHAQRHPEAETMKPALMEAVTNAEFRLNAPVEILHSAPDMPINGAIAVLSVGGVNITSATQSSLSGLEAVQADLQTAQEAFSAVRNGDPRTRVKALSAALTKVTAAGDQNTTALYDHVATHLSGNVSLFATAAECSPISLTPLRQADATRYCLLAFGKGYPWDGQDPFRSEGSVATLFDDAGPVHVPLPKTALIEWPSGGPVRLAPHASLDQAWAAHTKFAELLKHVESVKALRTGDASVHEQLRAVDQAARDALAAGTPAFGLAFRYRVEAVEDDAKQPMQQLLANEVLSAKIRLGVIGAAAFLAAALLPWGLLTRVERRQREMEDFMGAGDVTLTPGFFLALTATAGVACLVLAVVAVGGSVGETTNLLGEL